MELQVRKIPKWKIKQELNKTQSFDSSLAELGTKSELLAAQTVSEELKNPSSKKDEVKGSCTTE
ncbi:hypothetical protein [Brumimicrobium oceani]|uniref:Uncharacterized protein n=1 Tax=Brumimicrobium oceani TaxID=2100725 RepID=A0A2U2XGN3_9FLAO|nr:hypothetical protein [Brumimicrobium oceani]PWH86923.1 hypothetical protein DIT68_01290 [Brumimicrobium oceani]